MKKTCLYCGSPIWEERKGRRKYCNSSCRSYFNRNTQNSIDSITKRRANEEYFDRVRVAFEMYKEVQIDKRDEWLQGYIDNPTTKHILTNSALLKSNEMNIVKVADNYVQATYGVRIYDYFND